MTKGDIMFKKSLKIASLKSDVFECFKSQTFQIQKLQTFELNACERDKSKVPTTIILLYIFSLKHKVMLKRNTKFPSDTTAIEFSSI